MSVDVQPSRSISTLSNRVHTSAKRWSPQARISTEPIVFEEALPCGPENKETIL